MTSNPTLRRVRVTLGRGRHYVVVRDDKGLIRIEFEHAILGWKPLNLNGRVAKRVLAAEPLSNEAPHSFKSDLNLIKL